MSTPIYRTVYQVEVFSRGPLNDTDSPEDPFGLAEVNYAITEGDCIGNVECIEAQQVNPNDLQEHLARIGNDGSFFDEL